MSKATKISENLGAQIDLRPQFEKEKDYMFQEAVAAAAPVVWIEKDVNDWREFPEQDQVQSSTCVAQTIKKIAGILLWLKEKTFVKFSATPVYQARVNKPSGGMVGVDAFEIWRKEGVTLEDLVASDKMSEDEVDSAKVEAYERRVGEIFKIAGHIGINNGDFDTVASVIQQTGKGVMVWFYFTSSEFGNKADKSKNFSIPVVKTPSLTIAQGSRHSITAVDFFTYKGVEYILCEDSAHFGGVSRRLITREFFNKRNWFVRYPMNFSFEEGEALPIPPAQPKYRFTKVLEFSPTFFVDEDVKHLQDILKYEGLFPTNIESTGYYGAITAKAVYNWQVKHAVASMAELNSLQGRRAGEKTISSLNKIYG